MLLNPAFINYSIGDRVLFLAFINEYHGDGDARPLGNGYLNRDHFRRTGALALVEGNITLAMPGMIRVEYDAFPDEQRNRDYGRYAADFGLTQRGIQTAVNLLTAYHNYIGQPARATREQFDFMEQFTYPVPLGSTGYLRMIRDLAVATGHADNIGQLRLADVEKIKEEATRLGITYYAMPAVDPAARLVDGQQRVAMDAVVDGYKEWCEARAAQAQQEAAA